MKVFNTISFLAKLQKRLGNDLVYSLALDTDGTFYISVATHKSSKRKFKDNKMHPCKLTDADLLKHEFVLIEEIANIYESLLTTNLNKDIL